MAKRRTVMAWLTALPNLWKIGGTVVAIAVVIGLYAGMPSRMAKAEEQIDDLKGWAREVQGYTRAMQEQQQAPPQPWDFIRQEGDWQVFRDPDGQLQCCDGTQCIPHPPKGRCPS